MKLRDDLRDRVERLVDRSTHNKANNAHHPVICSEEIATLQTAHERRCVKVQLATIVASAVSITLTSMGMMSKMVEVGLSETIGLGVAALSSIAAGTVLTTSTLQLFNVAISAAQSQRRHVIGLMIGLIIPVLGISTSFAVIGTAGSPSLIYDMEAKSEQWGAYFAQSVRDAERAYDAEATLRPLRQSLCQMAADEKAYGTLSRSAGAGPISAGYASSCINLSTILETLHQTMEGADARRAQAMGLVAELQTVARNEDIGDAFARQQRFREITATLEGLIQASGMKNIQKTLTAQLDIMENSVASLDVAQTSFGNIQKRAVDHLKASLSKVKHITAGLFAADGLDVTAKPERLLDMNQAVVAHYKRNIQQILLAALLDLMPIFSCFLLMVSRDIPAAHLRESRALSKRHPTHSSPSFTGETE